MDTGIPPRLLLMFLAGMCDSPECEQLKPNATEFSYDLPSNKTELIPYDCIEDFGCYKLHHNATWTDARNKCAEESANLTVLNSEKEHDAVLQTFSSNPEFGDEIFLGFREQSDKGNYSTFSGEPLENSGFVKWAEGQPESGKHLNCGGLKKTGGLMVTACDYVLSFLCERQII